jgi:hypothetical protein
VAVDNFVARLNPCPSSRVEPTTGAPPGDRPKASFFPRYPLPSFALFATCSAAFPKKGKPRFLLGYDEDRQPGLRTEYAIPDIRQLQLLMSDGMQHMLKHCLLILLIGLTLPAWARNWNAKTDWRATGDGETDDSPSIQQGVTAMRSGDSVLFTAPGTYFVASTVKFGASGIRVKCEAGAALVEPNRGKQFCQSPVEHRYRRFGHDGMHFQRRRNSSNAGGQHLRPIRSFCGRPNNHEAASTHLSP